MSNNTYKFEQTENKRWGIYLQDRLLATVGTFEACQSIVKSLDRNLSYLDAIKVTSAYKKAINRSLVVK